MRRTSVPSPPVATRSVNVPPTSIPTRTAPAPCIAVPRLRPSGSDAFVRRTRPTAEKQRSLLPDSPCSQAEKQIHASADYVQASMGTGTDTVNLTVVRVELPVERVLPQPRGHIGGAGQTWRAGKKSGMTRAAYRPKSMPGAQKVTTAALLGRGNYYCVAIARDPRIRTTQRLDQRSDRKAFSAAHACRPIRSRPVSRAGAAD